MQVLPIRLGGWVSAPRVVSKRSGFGSRRRPYRFVETRELWLGVSTRAQALFGIPKSPVGLSRSLGICTVRFCTLLMGLVVGDFVVGFFVEDAFGHHSFPELDARRHDGVDEFVHQRLGNASA